LAFHVSSFNGNDITEYAFWGEARYYLRSRKKDYTFKGFFLRSGLVYFHHDVSDFIVTGTNPTTVDLYPTYRRTAGLMTGFGYQVLFLKKCSLEINIGTSAGLFWGTSIIDTKLPRLDAFKWNEIGIKLGYAF
jgi:putative salt-induced outer membrane protein YdiY